MIHYHGTPITPNTAAADVLMGKHAFISHANPQQLKLAMEVCQSFAIDNGAFPAWKKKSPITNWQPYYDWLSLYLINHPGFDFAVIPDTIDGDEVDNDALINEWPFEKHQGAPVWHMHESIDKFYNLCHDWPRVCIGSSGEYATIGTRDWWRRINQALNEVVNDAGLPPCKLHGLRMLNPKVFTRIPFASVDSTNIGRNIGIDKSWKGNYMPPDKSWRAKVMAARIESHNSAQYWEPLILEELL